MNLVGFASDHCCQYAETWIYDTVIESGKGNVQKPILSASWCSSRPELSAYKMLGCAPAELNQVSFSEY